MTEEKKQDKRELSIYPLSELGGGVFKAYFTTYISMLMTSVYQFPVVVAGILETIQSAIQWFGSPIMGTVYDRFSFKKGKFWPWFLIAGAGTGILYIIVFGMPVIFEDPSKLVIPAAIFIALAAFMSSALSTLGLTIYMYVAKTEKTRSFLEMVVKICRDGMKIVVGWVFPVMLTYFITFMPEMNAWAMIAVILAAVAIVIFVIASVLTKNSEIEREAQTKTLQRKKKTPILKTFKGILTNRALLVTFLAMTCSKVFFFFHITGAAYFWRYYMNNFEMLSIFNVAFSLAAIIGAALMPTILKIFKDTKRSYVFTMFVQAGLYAVSLLIVSPENTVGTIAILSAASFFNGISDGFILPLFGQATDYNVWKTGNKDYGLTMSTYSISIRAGNVASITIRTSLLAAAGFNSKALAGGAAVPAAVQSVLYNLNTLFPLILALVIALLVLFLNPINDKKAEQYRKEIKERDMQEAAS